MTARDRDPERLSDRVPGGPDREDAAGALLRLAAPLAPIAPDVAARVLERLPVVGRRVSWRLRAGLALATVAMAAAAAAAAVRWNQRRVVPPVHEGPAVRAAPVIVPAPEVAPVPEPAPTPPPVAIAPAPGRPRAALRRPPAVADEPPEVAESRLLASALRRLRHDKDAAAALALLDQHRQQFPSGMLVQEAAVARAEAHLAASRPQAALEVLDGMALGALPRQMQMLVLRGELRAGANRCADAVADFELALGRAPGRSLEERALYGRASCRARRGDQAGAAADLRLYLTRFPAGRFSAEARRALRGAP